MSVADLEALFSRVRDTDLQAEEIPSPWEVRTTEDLLKERSLAVDEDWTSVDQWRDEIDPAKLSPSYLSAFADVGPLLGYKIGDANQVANDLATSAGDSATWDPGGSEPDGSDGDNRHVRAKTQHSPSNLDVTLERTEQQLSAQLLTLQGAKDGSTRAVKRKMDERDQTSIPLDLPCEPFALPSMVTATANDKDPDTFGDGIIRPPGNKLYRAQLPSEYRSPVLQDDPLSTHDWMFKNHGKSLKKQRTELLPRSDTITIKFDVGKDNIGEGTNDLLYDER